MKCWLFILVFIFFSFLKGAHLDFVIMKKVQSPVSEPPAPSSPQLLVVNSSE